MTNSAAHHQGAVQRSHVGLLYIQSVVPTQTSAVIMFGKKNPE